MRFRSTTPTRGKYTMFEGAMPSRWTSFTRNPRAIALTVGIISTLFVFWLTLPHYKQSLLEHSGAYIPSLKHHYHNKVISNGTLGFEKIYAIGLSDRTDRRDSMEVAADVSGLKIEWMDGVTPNDMPQKTIPPAYKLDKVLPGVIGCWRSHMNVIREIVRNKVSSALIFEDDADWDLRIVEQMQDFAGATKSLLQKGNQVNDVQRPISKSPYGEGWDILWIGHCGGFQGNTSSVPHYIIKDDETVPPAMAMDDMLLGITPYRKWGAIQPEPPCTAHEGRDPPGHVCNSPRLAPRDRIVQERAKPVCTASYAISLQGARKILARVGGLSLTDVFAPVDQGIGDICSGATDLPGERTRCFTPSPPYVRGYKAKGMQTGDSDIRVTGAKGEKRKVGWSKGIMQSVRLHASAVVAGIDFEPEDQYVRDGYVRDGPYSERLGEGFWRLRKPHEYRWFKEDVVVDRWVW